MARRRRKRRVKRSSPPARVQQPPAAPKRSEARAKARLAAAAKALPGTVREVERQARTKRRQGARPVVSRKAPVRRRVIMLLETIHGRNIGRVTRQKLKRALPEATFETLCKNKRQRREAMFATSTIGKGRSIRTPRRHDLGKC